MSIQSEDANTFLDQLTDLFAAHNSPRVSWPAS